MEAETGAYSWVMIYTIMMVVFLINMILIIILFAYKEQLWEQELKKVVLQNILETEEKERQRFAADLHDALSGSINALNLYIATLDELTNEQKLFLHNKCIALTDRVRSISHNMMPPALQRFGLKAVLEDHCEQFQGSDVFDFCYDWKGEEPAFELPTKLNIYRIANELLHNAVKHAKASKISVKAESNQAVFFLEVKDNGIGWNRQNASTGVGLKNIQDRIFVIGGTLEQFTPPEGGTTIQVTLK